MVDPLILERDELVIVPQVEKMGRQMMADCDETDSESGPLEYYGEQYMESLSEAGYTETDRNDRLSCRAFGNLLKVKAIDLSRLKNALSYRRTDYHNFGLCQTLTQVLSGRKDLAPAVVLLSPKPDAQPAGPFYPNQKEFDLTAGVNRAAASFGQDRTAFLKKLVADSSRPKTDADKAAVKLAGFFRVNNSERKSLERSLRALGAKGDAVAWCAAHATLCALRATPRLVTGLRWSQPESK